MLYIMDSHTYKPHFTMKLNRFLIAVCTAFLGLSASFATASDKGDETPLYLNNRPPLAVKSYMALPLGAIKAEGWLEQQLNLMKDGMTGHLDELYPQVMGPRNGWLGGDGDVWERGPYWIDGLLPLAYILDDDALKAKVQPWIEWALASQKENGYFGPDTDREYEFGLQRNNAHDWWPKMVMLKIMQQYYMATQDERVIPFLTNYFRYQLNELPNTPLDKWTYWGRMRGGDNLAVIYWLYNITGDKFLLDAARIVHEQTYDWTGEFLKGELVRTPFSVHCVNLGQGFKEPVVYWQFDKDSRRLEAVKKAVRDMRHTIAYPTGLWAGDELLRYADPTQGSELCTAVEMMFSLETMLEITGDGYWGDYLERVAFNALPTQVTDAYDARQYYQQCNQIEVSYQDRNFVTCYNGTDQCLGLLAGYPCCTSNLHQGWPKFVQNLWYASVDGGAAALVYGPSRVNFTAGDGTKVEIVEETAYPMEENIEMTVNILDKKKKSVIFPLHLRIPAWSRETSIAVNGEKIDFEVFDNGIAIINREWKKADKLSINFSAEVTVSRWYERSATVERGPLVYALKMNEKWEKKEFDPKYKGNYGKDYWEVTSDSPWNYCLVESHIKEDAVKENFQVVKREIGEEYFWNTENAPISIMATGCRIPLWHEYNGSTGPIPYSVQYRVEIMPEETIELIPYGCTTLRITEFPVTRINKKK